MIFDMRMVSGIFLLFFAATAVAQSTSPPSQLELNGIFLGQFKQVPERLFGRPLRTEKFEDGWTYRAYALNKDTGVYMAFKFSKDFPEEIYSLQIAGPPDDLEATVGESAPPFVGIRLGDSREKLLSVFGKPSKIEPESDWPVELWSYDGRNYSFEVNKQGRLSSIQIMGYDGFPGEPKDFPTDLTELKKCLSSAAAIRLEDHSSGCLADWIAPGIEIEVAGRSIYVKRPLRTELSDPNSEVMKKLVGKSGSLVSILENEKPEQDPKMRLSTVQSFGAVTEFPKSKTLKEIVFHFISGKWRLWEVSFR